MIDSRTLAGHVAALAWVAFRSFVGTVFVLFLAGIVLAGLSYHYLSDRPLYAGIAAVLAVVESVAAGFMLGGKRAIVRALRHGLNTWRLGKAAVQMVFGRLLGVSAGQPGGAVVQTIERLPLAEAEKRLGEAIEDLAEEAGGATGWLRRGLHRRLLGAVQKVTLARFRDEGAGGVDLRKAQAELADKMDSLLLGKLRTGLRLWTIVVVLGLPLLVAAQTYLARVILHSNP
jgi:hypothetical protein